MLVLKLVGPFQKTFFRKKLVEDYKKLIERLKTLPDTTTQPTMVGKKCLILILIFLIFIRFLGRNNSKDFLNLQKSQKLKKF